MRNWLLDHNIIGSKDGVKSESTGFVYRIPTQGLSSMPSIRVADVVPSSMGDVIVVPDEFTAMTTGTQTQSRTSPRQSSLSRVRVLS